MLIVLSLNSNKEPATGANGAIKGLVPPTPRLLWVRANSNAHGTYCRRNADYVKIVRRTKPWLAVLKTNPTLGNSMQFGQDELSGLSVYKALDMNGCAQALMDSLLPTTRSSRLNAEREIIWAFPNMAASRLGTVATYNI